MRHSNSLYSDSLFRLMWIFFIVLHKVCIFWPLTLFWRWWWANCYGEYGVYSLMYLAKEKGYPWAQPFGGGEEAVRKYLGWKVKE